MGHSLDDAGRLYRLWGLPGLRSTRRRCRRSPGSIGEPVRAAELQAKHLHARPVPRAIGEVQQSLLTFAAAIEIHMEILEFVSAKRLEDSEAISGYLEEVEKARDGFVDSCDYADAMISQSGSDNRESWRQRIESIRSECTQLLDSYLFALNPVLKKIEITESVIRFRKGLEAFCLQYCEIVDILLNER